MSSHDMMVIATIALVAILCGTFGALGRHHQGGASHRWIGLLLYIPIMIPAAAILGPHWWIGTTQVAGLIAGWFIWILMKEQFGSLWHSTWRYGGPIIFTCVVTGFWWGVPAALLVWLAAKWAKEDHQEEGIPDPHRIFEFILGGVYGAVWGVAPFLGSIP